MNTVRVMLLSLTAAALLPACSFNKKGADTKIKNSEVVLEETRRQLSEQSAATIQKSDVKVNFVGVRKAGEYKLEIIWPSNVPSVEITFEDQEAMTIVGKDRYEKTVHSGQKIKFSFKTKTLSGLSISSFEFEDTTPTDYTFPNTQDIVLQSDLTIQANRVFFPLDSVVILNGHSLTIEANEVLFDRDSRILTFPADQAPTRKMEWLEKGSTLKIIAKRGVGMASIFMLGAHGAKGLSGDELAKMNGLDFSIPAANGSMGEMGRISERCKKDFNCVQTCMGATPPQAGQDGAKGLDGQRGYPGGTPGTLVMQIDDYSQLATRITVRRGLPGQGGAGGKGQQPGKGGAPHPQTCAEGQMAAANGQFLGDGSAGFVGHEAVEEVLEIPYDPQFFMITKINPTETPRQLNRPDLIN